MTDLIPGTDLPRHDCPVAVPLDDVVTRTLIRGAQAAALDADHALRKVHEAQQAMDAAGGDLATAREVLKHLNNEVTARRQAREATA